MITLIKVVLIDDEELILTVLKKKILWHNYNMEVVQVFLDGLEAYEYLLTNDIDVVFTDMKMPRIMGYELIGRVHKLKPSIKFIALSAYDDFTSVKNAFKEGALDYILKINIDSPQMDELLDKLQEEHTLTENNNEQALMNYIRNISCNTHYKLHYPLCSFIISSGNETNQELIKKQLNQLKQQYKLHWMRYEGQFAVFIIRVSKSIKDYTLRSLIKCCTQKDCIHIGMSSIATLEDGYLAYSQARQALKDCQYYHLQVLDAAYQQDIKKLKELFQRTKENIYQYIATYEIKPLEPLIAKLFQALALNLYPLDFLIEELLQLDHFINDMIKIMNISQNSLIKNTSQLGRTIHQDQAYFRNTMITIQTMYYEKSNKDVYSLVKSYVDNNFHRNITLSHVANKFKLSPSHLSKQFKKRYNINFQVYMKMLRIEKAKQLLTLKDAKVSKVYDEVGFENMEHFSRVFKKTVGMSPSHYMKEFGQ